MNQETSKALWHDAFYKFVAIDAPAEMVPVLYQHCQSLDLKGSILVASEGINGMLAGTAGQLECFRELMRSDDRFDDMAFKRSACQSDPFGRLKVKLKKEIVPLGLEGVNAVGNTGIDVSPEEWRELINQDDVVLVDNRNDFEVRLGKFKGAINPQVDHFRDFPAFVEAQLPSWQGKRIAMYCTGGIRCEKTSAWLKESGLEVYQLEGGIINYFERMPDAAADFEGECFVFDNRIALDTRLQETPTSLEDIYKPEEQWRLERAKALSAETEQTPR